MTSDRVGVNTRWLSAGSLASGALAVVSTALVAKVLGQVGFGQYAVLSAALALVGMVLDAGLNNLIILRLVSEPVDPNQAKGLVRAARSARLWAALGFLVCALVAVAAGVVGPALAPAVLVGVLGQAAWSVAYTSRIVLRSAERMDLDALLEMGGRVLFLAGVILAGPHLTLLGTVALGAAVECLDAVVSRYMAHILLGSPAGVSGRNHLPALLREAPPYFWNLWWGQLYWWADNLLVGWGAGAAAAGMYALAYRAYLLLITIPAQFAGAVFPALTPREGERSGRWAPVKAVVTGTGLGVAVAVLGAAVGGPLIQRMFGSAYAQAVPLLWILCLAAPLRGLNFAAGAALTALGRQAARTRIAAVVAVVNIVLNLASIPHWGAMAAAWVMVISEALLAAAFLTQLFGRPVLPVPSQEMPA